jgi:hypothetical protein
LTPFFLEDIKAGDNRDKDPIPSGTYDGSLRTDHDPRRIELSNVTGYSNIQLHKGNTSLDVKGCFAVGKETETDKVKKSGDALNEILSIIDADATGNISIEIKGETTETVEEDTAGEN